MACPRTGADGRFSVRVPAGASSRTIALAYRAHVGDALPVATRTLGLAVRAGVRLRVSPHTTSVGHTIHFTGALLGGRSRMAASSSCSRRARRAGPGSSSTWSDAIAGAAYRDSYTFKFPGPVDYRFRALSEGEADFPYATGASNVVRVHER